MNWIFYAVCVITAAVFVVLGFTAYDGMTAETFSLRKDSWVCTKEHSGSRFILVGKVPVRRDVVICDQWTAR